MKIVTQHETLVGIVFNSRDDAWEFYKDYAKNNGFSVCRSTTRHDEHGNVKEQGFCCTQGGVRRKGVVESERKRVARAITRIGCKAKVIVKCTDSSKWTISFFHSEHNHSLCPPAMRPFLRSNRDVDDASIVEARALKKVRVRTSHVMNYFTQQSGGFHNVGFIRKDLYNALQKTEAVEICDGDVNAVLAYFDFKKEQDIGLCIQYNVDDSGGLQNLFWCDSTSRSDYACFGDVIAFDTTYKGNMYGRPLFWF
ncbi:hypothetical protein V6N13_043520 [Hibiscus sabdariffa]